jgi:hypothetical protein
MWPDPSHRIPKSSLAVFTQSAKRGSLMPERGCVNAMGGFGEPDGGFIHGYK